MFDLRSTTTLLSTSAQPGAIFQQPFRWLKSPPVPPLYMAYWRFRAQRPACILPYPLYGKGKLDCAKGLGRQDWKGLPSKVPISCHHTVCHTLCKYSTRIDTDRSVSGQARQSAVVTNTRTRYRRQPMRHSAADVALPAPRICTFVPSSRLRVERKLQWMMGCVPTQP